MIGKFPKVGPRVYGGFDADAQAFITAAGITDATQQQAINTLVVDMKGYGIWTKMKAIYPFVGGTATTHKYNLKDPRDLDAAFRLSFNGGWTHSSNGALPNGSNAYADTYFSQLNGFDSVSSASIGAYIRTDSSSNSGDMGAGGTNTASSGMLIYSSFGGSTYYGCALAASIIGTGSTNTDSKGFYSVVRDSGVQRQYKRGDITINVSETESIGTISNLNIYIGGLNPSSGNTLYLYSDRQTAFNFIGSSLTQTEIDNFYTAVQAFQTKLSRNV
jgi:hypothetical protein